MSVQYVFAQQNTFILIRHAEKDTTVQGSTTMNANPPLSKQGLKRAKKLVKALKKYSVDEIYSTDFVRTKTSVEPLSSKFPLPRSRNGTPIANTFPSSERDTAVELAIMASPLVAYSSSPLALYFSS